MSKLDNGLTCMAPWVSIHHWPNGKAYPCCLWDTKNPIGNLNKNTLSEIWNSDILKETRRSMLKGEKILSCNRCYELEATGEHSLRKRINSDYEKYIHYLEKTQADGSLDFMNLHLWDLRISNFCNFKCRSCGSNLSSSWHEDTVKLGVIPKDSKALININDRSKLLTDIEQHYSCVDEIYFAGGEPLLMPEHYLILDRLIELGRTDVIIRYSTNLSKLKFGSKDILEYWRQFKNIEIYISVDGVKEIGEYIRKGFNYQNFINNVKTLRNSNINTNSLRYIVTYGVLNILHLFDIVIEFINCDLFDYKSDTLDIAPALVFSPITYPTHYDCKYIPTRYKNMFKHRLSTFDSELRELGASESFISTVVEKFNVLQNYITSGDFNQGVMDDFVYNTGKLDDIRKEDFNSVIHYYPNVSALADNTY